MKTLGDWVWLVIIIALSATCAIVVDHKLREIEYSLYKEKDIVWRKQDKPYITVYTEDMVCYVWQTNWKRIDLTYGSYRACRIK